MKLFGGGQKVATPATPKPVRMPVETDPAVMQAAQRTRNAAMMRQGRLSTIMTDQTKATTGSSGQKLGA
jgi:hypothetical protein